MSDTPLHGPFSVQSFAILNINPGVVQTTFMESLMIAMDRFYYDRKVGEPKLDGVILTHSGPYLDDGRNKAIEKAMNADATSQSDIYLFVDSDVQFDIDDVLHILAHDFTYYPVIAGSYRNIFNGGWSPVIYTHRSLIEGEEPTGAMDLNPIGDDGWHLLDDCDDDENLKTCHVAGAGFLAISRDFLVKLGEVHGKPCPWFAEAISQDRTHLGEDTTFCLRVFDLGYRVAVDPRIRLSHTKPLAISGKAP